MRTRPVVCATVIGSLLTLAFAPPLAAQLSKTQQKCQATIGKESGKFVKAVLKHKFRCVTRNLDETGSCDLAKRDAKIAAAESKLRTKLRKKCVDPFPPEIAHVILALLGFPGKCPDPDSTNGFTGEDLENCLVDTHAATVDELFYLQYGANGVDGVIDFETRAANPGLGKRLAECQKRIGSRAIQYVDKVQKEISKCRDKLIRGTFSGFRPIDCADNPIDVRPALRIAKAASKARELIQRDCRGSLLADPLMDVCDVGSGPQTTEIAAADCIVDTHTNAVDDADNSGQASPFAIDLIDIEYALGAVCGDNIVNEPAAPSVFSSNFHLGAPPEECDGLDDDACPGLCGAPDGSWACLCTDRPRIRVIEHENGDLDHGWTGTSHDAVAVEGSGYVLDLHDCDGPFGPDTACTVGPSCVLAPNPPCSSDADCTGGGNFCRKTVVATGPHCDQNVQAACTSNADCANPGDFCRKTPHGSPLPLSAGGVAVCVVNVFSEDVVGTLDLDTGDADYRLRQAATTHLTSGTLNQPCPSCGGFCSGPSGGSAPGARTLCGADSDCPASAVCVTDAVCSFGPNEDQPCRRDAPFGHATTLLGTPSVDCPPAPGSDISSGGLDILFAPATTGTLVSLPSEPCNAPGLLDKRCIFGTSIGAICGADSDCAGGGTDSCVFQCFCPSVGGTLQKPNDCFPACRGGSNDYEPCNADSDCPGGLCHPASCRLAAGVCTAGGSVGTGCSADSDCGLGGTCGDDDSSGEGFCPAGPIIGQCSFTTLETCFDDSECRPSGGCAFCRGDESETCIFRHKDCLPNEGYTRMGVPGYPDRIDVAHFCIPASNSAAVNSTAGLPGPGALELPLSIELSP